MLAVPKPPAAPLLVWVLLASISGCFDDASWQPNASLEPKALRVLRSFPQEQSVDVALNTPIWLEFDQYLDPRTLQPSPVLLKSASGGVGVRSVYRMVDKRLLLLPTQLQANFRYSLSVSDEFLRSVEGSALKRVPKFSFTTASAEADWGQQREGSRWSELAVIMERSCSCHQLEPRPASWFDIVRLSPDELVGKAAWQQPSTMLISPGAAWDSYLMHKALPDYPYKRGSAMPPAWSGQSEATRELPARALDANELRALEEWINAGAQP